MRGYSTSSCANIKSDEREKKAHFIKKTLKLSGNCPQF
jgi:hypothetical protein